MPKSIVLTAGIVLLALTSACNKDIIIPDLEGNLVGYVVTLDEFGQGIPAKENVVITAAGAGTHTTETNEDGRFEFSGLPAGTYEITAEKEGFGLTKKISIKHLGGKPTVIGLRYDGSNYDAFRLYELPKTTVTNMVFENDSLTGTFAFPRPPSYIYQDVLISITNQADYATTADLNLLVRSFMLKNGIYRCPLNSVALGYSSGETIHFKVKVCSYGIPVSDHISHIEDNTYFNYETLSYFYPALGAESGWFSYVVPE